MNKKMGIIIPIFAVIIVALIFIRHLQKLVQKSNEKIGLGN